jgi:hypothetical protein
MGTGILARRPIIGTIGPREKPRGFQKVGRNAYAKIEPNDHEANDDKAIE